MRDTGIVWNTNSLNHFLEAPLEMVPGTTMGFAGISDENERRNLIAWLATLNASSDLCRDVLLNQTGGP
jgi:cytochrome c